VRALIVDPATAEHKAVEDVHGGVDMRAIAVVGWLWIVGALLVWQGIGLVRGPEWPTLSDFFRSFMTVPLGVERVPRVAGVRDGFPVLEN
jgi:hypothetical protein